jgi:propanol-preferring alcohol dehydrogenase
VTTYKAVKVAGTRSSDLVAGFGVGGLGHLAIQYAAIAGGRVIAVDIHDSKLELARELGAEFTVNAANEDPIAAIQRLGGANQAIALAVSPRAFEQAYGSLRRGGALVFVALPADNEVKLPDGEFVDLPVADRARRVLRTGRLRPSTDRAEGRPPIHSKSRVTPA